MNNGTLKERFDRFIYYSLDGCWYWTGCLARHGYGRISNNGRCVSATRISYTLHKGVIPKTMCVCHSCDNPMCVNPDHLWLGTQGDNMKDMFKKRRRIYSNELHPGARLNPETVRMIRSNGRSPRDLADELKVSLSCVNAVIYKRTWKSIT